ncbi:MAG: GNAT family N-acetyltransferase [Coriobacteriaceae bacterium]|nr:MAG: GNAT family N-acetyltransferase [Coriobacteriaceae bacterium]
MRLRDMMEQGARGFALVGADAAPLLHGSVRTSPELEGWVRPWRFSAEQMRALGSCQAWHPGLYRQMARATAGVCLEFETDSSEVAIEVALDAEPVGTRDALKYVDERRGLEPRMHDGLSCEVDGRRLGVRVPADGDDYVAFTLDDPAAAPASGVMQLPGMGDTHHVRVWLPCLRGCTLRSVAGNGSFIRPVERRRNLLVLGDSIAQGFVCDDPALAWPTLLAERRGLDVINQGVGGQVFQPGTLFGLARAIDPAAIVVELGENYRYEPCRERLVSRDVRAYLAEVSRLWGDVPTWVLTPMWHNEDAYASHKMSCFAEVPQVIRAQAEQFGQMRVVEGAGLLDHDAALLADGYEHPGAQGCAQIARRLELAMDAGAEPREELSRRAADLLARAPRRTIPMAECLARGLGEVTHAEEGMVAVRAAGGVQMAWGHDAVLARDVASVLMPHEPVLCLEPSVADDLQLALGLGRREACHVATLKRKASVKVPSGRLIRPLGEGDLSAVRQRMSHPERQSDEQTLELLRQGRYLGGFDEDARLVAFVGEDPWGAMDALEVFPEHQRHGWAGALVAAKANQLLGEGRTPWCCVGEADAAALRVLRKLGFTVLPATEACWLLGE